MYNLSVTAFPTRLSGIKTVIDPYTPHITLYVIVSS